MDKLENYHELRGRGGSFEPAVGGFIIRGGAPYDLEAGARLFSRDVLPDRGKLLYSVTVLRFPDDVDILGCWLDVGLVWNGSIEALEPRFPTSNHCTARNWRGWRITHANISHDGIYSDIPRTTLYPSRVFVSPQRFGVAFHADRGERLGVSLAWGSPGPGVVSMTAEGGEQVWSHGGLVVPPHAARLMWYGSPGGAWLVEPSAWSS